LLVALSALWAPAALAHPSHATRETAPAGLEAPVDIVPSPPADAAPERPVVRQDAAGSAAPVLLVAVAILLLGSGVVCAPGATARALLSLLIAITAAETSVHSIHHLDDPGGAKDCQVLTVAQQFHADAAPELRDADPLVALPSDVVVVVLSGATQSVRRPDQGRAPPLPIA
jgi:hypothetical protein